jgi:hypothetical protein
MSSSGDLVRKQQMFYPKVIMLFTLHTLLNVIVCCLELYTGRGADANLNVDY